MSSKINWQAFRMFAGKGIKTFAGFANILLFNLERPVCECRPALLGNVS